MHPYWVNLSGDGSMMVVNGSTTVAPEIRDAVQRAVRELGYVPNHAARSLATQRTNSMALVFPEPSARIFSDDPFFPGVVRGVSQELEGDGFQLVLMMARGTLTAELQWLQLSGHGLGQLFRACLTSGGELCADRVIDGLRLRFSC